MGVIFEEPTHNKKKKTAVCIGRHLNSNRHGIELISSVFLFGGKVAWVQKKSRSSDLSELYRHTCYPWNCPSPIPSKAPFSKAKYYCA